MVNLRIDPAPPKVSEPKRVAYVRNPGIEFTSARIMPIRLNHYAATARVATMLARRTVKGNAQTAWLAKAITCIDLTTLAGDDTAGRIKRLCAKARRPLRAELEKLLGLDVPLCCGAICVYPRQVKLAVEQLSGSEIPVAAVATGFPAGQIPHQLKLREIKAAVRAGAREIDVVVTREYALAGQWRKLYDEVAAFREACGPAHLKVILATGDLGTLRIVAAAAQVAMMAGADFIKTSTGKERQNATLPVALIMARAIRDYEQDTGYKVGFKPAGGVSTAKAAIAYQIMMREELGRPWLEPELFRIGASTLLGDIERQLEHRLTGSYSAAHRHPLA